MNDQISLDEIMKANVTVPASRISDPVLTIYVKAGIIRFNKMADDDLGCPSEIAFFVTGKHVFFIASPQAKGLETFEINRSKNIVVSSKGLSRKILTALDADKDEKSIAMRYSMHSTNMFGIIFKLERFYNGKK